MQDADRLDALGAIGLARCIAVGAALGRPLYEPDDPFCRSRAPDDGGASVDHFYTKLLKLAGTMQTARGPARGGAPHGIPPRLPRAARIGDRTVSRGVSASGGARRSCAKATRASPRTRAAPGTLLTAARRAKLTAAQEPFAIVLGCSDSRVPVELVFNQGPGDLFVIRVAGNIVAPSLIGSVEFAADRFGTRLVVVLGHSSCGAIAATIEELHRPTTNQSPNLRAIVDRIRPGVEELVARHEAEGALAVEHAAMTANVRASVDQLRHGSDDHRGPDRERRARRDRRLVLAGNREGRVPRGNAYRLSAATNVAASTLPPREDDRRRPARKRDLARQCGRERDGAARLDHEPQVAEGAGHRRLHFRVADRQDAGQQLAVDREGEPAGRRGLQRVADRARLGRILEQRAGRERTARVVEGLGLDAVHGGRRARARGPRSPCRP